MNFESSKNYITKKVADTKEYIQSMLEKETMFTAFQACEKELELMKKNGTYIELRTEQGELAAANGLPSKYKDYPNLYGVLQTPTFKKMIGDETNNVTVYEDTREPMIVYHSTPIDIPLEEGLKPHMKRGAPGRVLGVQEGIIKTIRRRFKLFPLTNLQLYFAQDANSTKTKAAASTRKENSQHKIYPCFIKVAKPYVMGNPDGEYSWNESDGTINNESGDFSVKSDKQVMHIPFNFIDIYSPEL